MSHTNCLDQVLIEAECPADGPGNLSDLQGMREAGAIVVAGGTDKDLGLMHQPAETLRMDHPVPVALERCPNRGWLLRFGAYGVFAPRCRWGQRFPFDSLDAFTRVQWDRRPRARGDFGYACAQQYR